MNDRHSLWGKLLSSMITCRLCLNVTIILSVESQKGAIIIQDVLLRTRRALSPYTSYSDSALLVLN